MFLSILVLETEKRIISECRSLRLGKAQCCELPQDRQGYYLTDLLQKIQKFTESIGLWMLLLDGDFVVLDSEESS